MNQELVEAAIKQILDDLKHDSYEPLCELLCSVPEDALKNFLTQP
jgi:hypothetical protein